MTVQASFSLRGRNPDVLSCIANLSNDEVFTPPEFANRMLDTLTEAWAADHNGASLWADPTVRFLDPCTKSGVFLREITNRLVKGLAEQIPDLQARVDHILTTQVFGIGITQLTSLLARRSLYCSKYANGPHSICKAFTTEAGNIWFERMKHTWKDGKCSYCGAPKAIFDREEGLETHAYALIHSDNIKARISELFGGDMQFDVIIGNPPYQLASDGGTRDIPIYHHFVEQAKMLEPRYLVMVIPSRWMAAGLGLSEFRQTMLSDKRIRELVDYPFAGDVFPGVEVKAGVCFFIRDSSYNGDCKVTSIRNGEVVGPVLRNLDEFDVLVRDARAATILRKVLAQSGPSINSILSRDKEFGWTSNYDGFHAKMQPGDVPLYYIRSNRRCIGYIARSEILKSPHLIDTWKLLVPKAYGAGDAFPHQILGKPIIASSPSVCTQSYLFFRIGSRNEAEALRSYYVTRFFRFLVSLRKITQDATHSTYSWVPMLTLDRTWTDAELYARFHITEEEQEYINSQVKLMSIEHDE